MVKGDFVGVVARKPWQAMEAARQLQVKWTPGVPLPPPESFYEQLRTQRPVRDSLVVDSGDTAARLGEAAVVFEATYRHRPHRPDGGS